MANYFGNNADNFFDYLGTEALTAYGFGGNDTLIGNTNDDALFGGNGNDYLDGFSGNDFLSGGRGVDTLIGGAGNDTLDGGFGNDLMAGGTGNDAYFVNSLFDAVVENAGEGIDTVYSAVSYTIGDNVENLVLTGSAGAGAGNALDNILIGNNNNNILYGLAGNDVFDGGLGIDTLLGGTGNDVYYADTTTDVIIENAGEGIDTVVASVSYTLGDNVENLVLEGNAIAGFGNASDNTLIGNNANNILYGLAGNDVLNGGLGIDTLLGGTGNDFYYVDTTTDVVIENAGEGIDTVISTVNYTLGETIENLILDGSAANGTGNSLNNSLTGNAGNNILSAGAGNDLLNGGAGNDILLGGSANDILVGGDGNDRLDGYSTTGVEFDALTGGSGSDTFILGGSWGVSYLGDGYATITDWNPAADFIEARGSVRQYVMIAEDFGLGSSSVADTGIFYIGNNTLDLIAVVQDSTDLSFSRDYQFV